VNGEPVDLLIRIRGHDPGATAYPVEAEIGDGSRFPGGALTIDPSAPVPDGQSEAYGRTLFDALFEGPIRTAYDKAVAESADRGLRIRLLIDPEAAELEGIRWERLYRERAGIWVPVSTAGDTPFSRYRARPTADPRPIATLPLRILLAVSNPAHLPPGFQAVDVRQEVETVYDALKSAAETDEVDVTILARRADLGTELCARLDGDGFAIVDGRTSLSELVRRLSGSHIVHFVGHGQYHEAPGSSGEREAALFLEGDDGDQFDPVTGAQLVQRFAAAEIAPALVYLSSCDSGRNDASGPHPFIGIAPRLIDAGVAAVVAMQDVVPVKTARSVSGDFYRSLFSTGLVDRALNQARSVVFDPGKRDWTIPVLITRLRGGRLLVDHEFANRVVSADITLTPEPEHGVRADRVTSVPVPHLRPAPVLLLPRDFPDLLGRQTEVRRALADLSSGSVVEFYGRPGSGKTVLLRNLANRAASGTAGGVVHLPNGSEPVDDLLLFLFDALYEADASLRPIDAALRGFLQGCEPVIAVDDADVPRDVVQQLIELVPKGRFLLAAMERNLWEGRAVALAGLPADASLALFERGVGRDLVGDEPARASALCAALEGIPLHILQAADQVAKGTWPVVPQPTPVTAPTVAIGDGVAPISSLGAAVIDSLTAPERKALAVIAAAGAPIRVEHIETLTGRPDASATCESLRRAGLVRTASPRYALAEPLPTGYDVELGVAEHRKRLLDHLVAWVDQNRRSPGLLARDLDLILAAIDADDADPARTLALARGIEGALIVSKRWQRWENLLDREVAVATAANDQAALGWARHAQGSRALALRDQAVARDRLKEALRIRKRLRDVHGAAVTRHNLELLRPPPPPPLLRALFVLGIVAVLAVAGVVGARVAIDLAPRPSPTAPGNSVPVAEFAPDRIDFGSVQIGASSQAGVVLTNLGSADLSVTELALDPPIDDLTIASTCPSTIPARTSCQIVLTFQPTAAGDRGTTLTALDNTTEGRHVVPISAQGVAPAGIPALEIKPQAIDFGVVAPGTTVQQKIAVVSTGTGAVAISAIELPAGGAFSIAGGDCSGGSLDPGKSCTIEVAFQPPGAGPSDATLAIVDSTPDGRHEVALVGEGRRGVPDLRAAFDVLGPPMFQDDGSIALPVIVIVRNDGDADASLFAIRARYIDTQIDPSQVLPAALVPDAGFDVTQDGTGAVGTNVPISPGSTLRFSGKMVFAADLTGRTLDLTVEADSCLGQEIFDPFVLAHCAVEEVDETNNISNLIESQMPIRFFDAIPVFPFATPAPTLPPVQ
jgi:hypothetical protein